MSKSRVISKPRAMSKSKGQWLKRQVLVSFCLLLSGCAVGPDFARPAAPETGNLRRDPMTTTVSSTGPTGQAQTFERGVLLQADWWKLYGSAKLNDLIELALKNNPTIDAARAALKQSQAYASAQRGYFFPTVQASFAPTRQASSNTIAPTLNSGDTPFTLNTAQVSVGFSLDVFGLNRRTLESLEAQAENQKFLLEAAKLSLATNIVSAVIQQSALQAQLKATQEIIAASKRSLLLLQQQAAIGHVSRIDVALQETALAQNEQLLPSIRKQLEQTRNQVAVLTGSLPSEAGVDHFEIDQLTLPASLPLSLPSQIVDQRPDVRAAEAQLHSASAQVGIAIASRLPQISLSAIFGGAAVPFNQMFTSSNQFWGLSGNISQTIFDFGTLKYRQVATEAGLEQASAQYRSTVLVAFQSIADTLYALDEDAKTLEAAVRSEAAAKQALDLTQQQLNAGVVSAFTLLSAEQSFRQTTVSRITAQANRLMNTAALFQALGGNWQRDPS
jgi:NodT family efflux transporter outer membrane factor (OMF) lipoprotein